MCDYNIKFIKMGVLGEFIGGLSGKKKEDFINGNSHFISYKNIYSNLSVDLDSKETVMIYENEKQHKIEYGDVLFTGSSETKEECAFSSVVTKKPVGDYYLNSFCFIWRIKDKTLFNVDFLKFLLRADYMRNQFIKTANGVTRYNVSKKIMEEVLIPVPPLEIQNKIVDILDRYSDIKNDLLNSLAYKRNLCNKMFDYYLKELLSTGDKKITLSNITEISTGSSNTSDAVENGKYQFFVRSQDPLFKNDYEYDDESIVIAGDGAGVGKVFHYVNGKYALHQRAYRIHVIDNKLNTKFLYNYMLVYFPEYIFKKMLKGSVPSIRRPMLSNFQISLPSLDKQNKIVNIIDKLRTNYESYILNNDLQIDLIEKQYSYYMNKLLTFYEE